MPKIVIVVKNPKTKILIKNRNNCKTILGLKKSDVCILFYGRRDFCTKFGPKLFFQTTSFVILNGI